MGYGLTLKRPKLLMLPRVTQNGLSRRTDLTRIHRHARPRRIRRNIQRTTLNTINDRRKRHWTGNKRWWQVVRICARTGFYNRQLPPQVDRITIDYLPKTSRFNNREYFPRNQAYVNKHYWSLLLGATEEQLFVRPCFQKPMSVFSSFNWS